MISEHLLRQRGTIPQGIRAKTQYLVFRHRFNHPGDSLEDVAKALGLSYWTVAQAWSRLRRSRNLVRLCPVCFHETLYSSLCQNCGADFREDDTGGVEMIDMDQHSPVYRIRPDGGLGEEPQYSGLRLQNRPMYIRHIVEQQGGDEARIQEILALIWEELKATMPRDDVGELAARLARKEYYRMKRDYPDLMSKKGFKEAVAWKVVRELRTIYRVGNGGER